MKASFKMAMLTAATLASMAPLGAAAQQVSSPEIVVTAEQMRERTAAFTDTIALASGSEDQYARWDDDICPRVAGLPAAEAQALIDHIATRAHQVGLRTGAAGCRANLIVMFAPDANAIARQVVDTRRDLMGYYSEDNTVSAGRDALEAFASTPRPVRWWHVSHTMSADGREIGNAEARHSGGGAEAQAMNQAVAAGDPAAGASAGAIEGVDTVRSSGARTRRNTRQDLRLALIIVDAPSVAGAPAAATSDYIAMAALAQLNPNADMSAFPSILNLFAHGSGPAPTAMTAWDSAFLQGLYRTRREAAARQQRSDIARRMADAIPTN